MPPSDPQQIWILLIMCGVLTPTYCRAIIMKSSGRKWVIWTPEWVMGSERWYCDYPLRSVSVPLRRLGLTGPSQLGSTLHVISPRETFHWLSIVHLSRVHDLSTISQICKRITGCVGVCLSPLQPHLRQFGFMDSYNQTLQNLPTKCNPLLKIRNKQKSKFYCIFFHVVQRQLSGPFNANWHQEQVNSLEGSQGWR